MQSPRMFPCIFLLMIAMTMVAGEAKPLLTDASFGTASLATETEKFMRLTVTEPGKLVSAYVQVPVAGITAMQFSYCIRYTKVKRGDKPWFDARILLDFKDGDGKAVKGGPSAPYYVGSSDGWRKESMRFTVPEGAVTLSVMPALFQAESGTMDLQNISLVAIDPADLPPIPTDVNGVQQVTVDGGKPAPQVLHGEGKRLLRADGTEVWLQGVSVDSLQWSNTGEGTLSSVIAAIESWKANIIRLPMVESRWFGRDKGQSDGGTAYRAIIDQAITAASSRGVYLIIDLHRFGAPKDDHVAFWKACAETYKDNPAVIFELFNEPHGISWEVWKNGGDVGTEKKQDPAVLAENKDAVVASRSPGMQAMVDAVRGTGAKNLMLVGGLDWAYDISGILKGFALDDRGGNGIAYVTHVYPWKSDWQGKFLDVAAQYPVVMTEVGCDIKRYDFIPVERFENPYSWAPDMIACIQKNRIHWTAFSFHPKCGPPMLQDTKDFTPTPFWGAFVRAALLGGTFQLGKMR